MSRFVESAIGRLLPSPSGSSRSTRHRFTRTENFSKFPTPTIPISSPDCGPSGSPLSHHHAADGDNAFPTLVWSPPPGHESTVKEYLIVVEDVDVPLSGPVLHGIYYGIPASVTRVESKGVQKVKKGIFERELEGGFKYAPVGRGNGKVWVGPNPLLNHGPHRYYFQIVALNATVDRREMSQFPTKESFKGAVEGKVLGWGEWIGTYERKS